MENGEINQTNLWMTLRSASKPFRNSLLVLLVPRLLHKGLCLFRFCGTAEPSSSVSHIFMGHVLVRSSTFSSFGGPSLVKQSNPSKPRPSNP